MAHTNCSITYDRHPRVLLLESAHTLWFAFKPGRLPRVAKVTLAVPFAMKHMASAFASESGDSSIGHTATLYATVCTNLYLDPEVIRASSAYQHRFIVLLPSLLNLDLIAHHISHNIRKGKQKKRFTSTRNTAPSRQLNNNAAITHPWRRACLPYQSEHSHP